MTPEQKKWIDEASYYDLLERWRFAPIGDPMFQGAVGEYYATVMKEKREADPAGAVATSKALSR